MLIETTRLAFSVIIPNWNGRSHLPECLDSLQRQTFKAFETIVVDNGSTDGSADLVRTQYPEVTLVTLPENRGFAGGVNAGIRIARGEYMALLNNDTAVDVGWLHALRQATLEYPDVWLFASKLVNYFDRSLVDSAGDGMDLDLGPYKIGDGESVEKYDKSGLIFGACGGGASYRRALLDKIGLFDEDYFAYYEDVDLAFRANWAGHRCLFVPGAVIYHKIGGTAAARPDAQQRFAVMTRRNLFMLIVKNYSLGLLLRHGFAILSLTALRKIGILLDGKIPWRRRLSEIFLPELQFLRRLPSILNKRRAVMRLRVLSDREMERLCARPPGQGRFFLTAWLRRRKQYFMAPGRRGSLGVTK